MKIMNILAVLILLFTTSCFTKSNVTGKAPSSRNFVGSWYEGDDKTDLNAPVKDARTIITESNGTFSMERHVVDEEGGLTSYLLALDDKYEVRGDNIILHFSNGTNEEYQYVRNGSNEHLVKDGKIVFTKFKW